MSFAEVPADTEARQILAALEEHGLKIERQTEALNSLGSNLQWLIDMAKQIFPMFASPMFGSMMSGMMPGSDELAEMAGALQADNSEESTGE